jgi:hypothetical protein
LDRRNRLRKICSSLLVLKTGRYWYGAKENIEKNSVYLDVEAIGIEYNCKPLMKFLEGYDQQFTDLATSLENRNTLNLFYEDDIEHDPVYAYKRVCDFVGVEPSTTIEVPHKKINPHPLSAIIENYEEIQDYLKGSAYEWMLEA